MVLRKPQIVDSKSKIEMVGSDFFEFDDSIGKISFEIISPLKGFFIGLLDLFHDELVHVGDVEVLRHERA